MIQEVGPVREVRLTRPAIFRLLVELPAIAQIARPGQFLHLLAPSTTGVLLRRPFSIGGIQGTCIDLLVRVVGTGTEAISHLAVGDRADVIGPLGAGFIRCAAKKHFLVGGGIGAAPLMFLQDELKREDQDTQFLLGAKTKAEYPLSEDEVLARQVIVSTDDGSLGQTGFVSKSFEAYLRDHSFSGAQVYSCGPVPMMKEVSRICAEFGLSHQVSLENRMGCGIGVCQGCALKLNKNDARGGYRLICKDGPVFNAADVEWSSIY